MNSGIIPTPSCCFSTASPQAEDTVMSFASISDHTLCSEAENISSSHVGFDSADHYCADRLDRGLAEPPVLSPPNIQTP